MVLSVEVCLSSGQLTARPRVQAPLFFLIGSTPVRARLEMVARRGDAQR